jgi:hypothetical protein
MNQLHMLFHSAELQCCEDYSCKLFPLGFPKDKNRKTEIGGSGRSQFSADYFVFKHLPYCNHRCIGSMCCSVILLKIFILYFFSSQVTEEGIQNVVNVSVRFHGFVEKYGANDSPRT